MVGNAVDDEGCKCRCYIWQYCSVVLIVVKFELVLTISAIIPVKPLDVGNDSGDILFTHTGSNQRGHLDGKVKMNHTG